MASLVVQQLLIISRVFTTVCLYSNVYDLCTGVSQTRLLFALYVLLAESSFQLEQLAAARCSSRSGWKSSCSLHICFHVKMKLRPMLSCLAAAGLVVTSCRTIFLSSSVVLWFSEPERRPSKLTSIRSRKKNRAVRGAAGDGDLSNLVWDYARHTCRRWWEVR